jgi:hypothetical protein
MFGGLLPSSTFPRDLLLYWDGGPSDRILKTAFTSTTTSAGTRIHRASSITFDGANSKIDCASQIAGAGNITLLAWFNATGYGEVNAGRIVDNGKFWVRVNSTNTTITVTSDGATEVSAATASAGLSAEIFVAVTRTSTGVVNIYKNGVLSGSANQASGTPAGGSTNLIIGNNTGQTATFNGTLSHVRIFSQILTTTQIGQIYNKER